MKHLTPVRAFWSLFSFALLQRLALLMVYQPAVFSDTKSYRRLAQTILDGWQSYDGTRTPGYPVFLALVGPDKVAWLVQLAMGLAITLLFFYLGWRLSGHAWFGGLVGLLHTLNLGQFFFESNLLTETPATFWLLVSLAGLYRGMELVQAGTGSAAGAGSTPRGLGWRLTWLAGGMGLASAFGLLTRPLFVFMPPWLLLCIALLWQPGRIPASPGITALFRWLAAGIRRTWLALAAFTLPVALVVGGWVGFIYTRYGDLSLTVMTGYHLVQHTGVFFEYAPDDVADIRDTYLRYREVQIARTGTQANTIWEAIPELQQVSGLNFYDLSGKMAEISLDLIREHPDLYLRNVVEGWWLFWRAPVYWSPGLLKLGTANVSAVSLVTGLIWLERAMLMLANLAFLATSLLALASRRLRQLWQIPRLLWVMEGTIWLTSIVQTLLDHGDNPRFLIPLQSWVGFWMAWLTWQSWQGWRSKGIKLERVDP